MATLFKRSNGIYYVVTNGKNGRRRWISTGEKTRSRALNHFKTQDEKPEVVQRSKRLSCFVREFLSSASSFYSRGTLGICENSVRHFLTAVGDQPLSATSSMRHRFFYRNPLRPQHLAFS